MPINTKPDVHTLVMCSNVFVRKDGKVLVLRRSPKKKYAPNVVHPVGGKLEPDEDPLLGGLRELKEEAGITVKNIQLEAIILEIAPVKGEDENWLIFHFSGDYEAGDIIETEEGELLLLDKEEILREDLFPSVQPIIDNILNPEDGTVILTTSYDDNGKCIVESKTILTR